MIRRSSSMSGTLVGFTTTALRGPVTATVCPSWVGIETRLLYGELREHDFGHLVGAQHRVAGRLRHVPADRSGAHRPGGPPAPHGRPATGAARCPRRGAALPPA